MRMRLKPVNAMQDEMPVQTERWCGILGRLAFNPQEPLWSPDSGHHPLAVLCQCATCTVNTLFPFYNEPFSSPFNTSH